MPAFLSVSDKATARPRWERGELNLVLNMQINSVLQSTIHLRLRRIIVVRRGGEKAQWHRDNAAVVGD